jgi:hypothetical protein
VKVAAQQQVAAPTAMSARGGGFDARECLSCARPR